MTDTLFPPSSAQTLTPSANILYGCGISGGIAFGQAIFLPPISSSTSSASASASDSSYAAPHSSDTALHATSQAENQNTTPHQQQAFTQALLLLTDLLRQQLAQSDNATHAELIEAELLLLEDEEFIQAVMQSIAQLHLSADRAIERVIRQHADELAALGDNYLAARAEDLISLGERLKRVLQDGITSPFANLPKGCILLADSLTPAEFSALPLENIQALVLRRGTLTCHTAILARSANLPALLGCDFNQANISPHTPLVLDATEQCLYINPDAVLADNLKQKQQQLAHYQQALTRFCDQPLATQDGQRAQLLGNIASGADISTLQQLGMDGVGLLRTELMLLNAPTLDDEELQYRLYCDCLRQLNGQTFTVRTLDIGADKVLACLPATDEINPALGVRGIRYSLAHPATLIPQLRALLRAANQGPLRLMVPMLNQPEEWQAFTALLQLCRDDLTESEQGYGPLSLGIVIETPAAALNLAAMLPQLDFISIGTNDLTQHTMAADRSNTSLSQQYPSLCPPVLLLIKHCITLAHQQGIPVSLCGELASNPVAVPLLFGMGLDEFSVCPSQALAVKAALANVSAKQCRKIAANALKARYISELEACISTINSQTD